MTTAYINDFGKLAWVVRTAGSTPDGFIAIEVDDAVTANSHYFDGVGVRAYSENELALKNVPPAYSAEWSDTLMQWVDSRSLQDIKDAKWAVIKQARVDAIDAQLVTPYGTFDADPKARTAITDAVLMLQTLASLGTPTTIDFTLADNTTMTLDTAQMVTVGLLLGQKVQAAHSRSRMRREAIEAATTAAEVDAVAW